MGCIRGCEEFENLGVKIVEGNTIENYVKNLINNERQLV